MARKFLTPIDMGGLGIVNLVTPSASSDAVTKAYVDGLIQGIEWKAPVRAATTTNGTLATAYANGQTVDGVTLATGDRVLLKNQTAGADNGIYVVAASGAPTRATDADIAAEVLQMVVAVEEGTTLADTAWACTTNAPITLGTTALTFAQLGGGGTTYSAGTGISLVSTTFSVDHSVVPELFQTDIGDASSTSITVTHNLGTKAVQVTVYDNTTPFAEVYPEVRHSTTNTVTLVFTTAPTSNQYHAVVLG